MKKIALIYMGGTFGCVGEPLTPMPAEQFLPQLKKILPLHLKVECMMAPAIQDSSAYTATDWLLLVQQIQHLQLQSYAHFVVIHGTDTLSYAAAVLAHCLGESCHVILTGSQYPLLNQQGDNTREFSDARDNLYLALDQVMQLPVGVYLAFHQQIWHGQTTLKVHSTELDAFRGLAANQSLDHKPRGCVVQEKHLQRAENFNILSWMIQPIHLAQLLQNLQTLLNHPPCFLVLQAFGTGNLQVNPEVEHGLQQLYERGCLTILSTQVPFGGIDQRYAVSQWLQSAKIIVNDCLSPADLYAKALQMYLQYPTAEQWLEHWHDQ